ncbi:hypothetical protein [Rhodococcus qingshengii]|uniref:hypothetical protein n=1 Tax=Rhodococcus qingshengii TaxID=334542 RepID=UPI0012E8DB28|nr:hypothetical protein [Rhodococcus qingshengii]
METRTLARADVYKWGAVTGIGVIAGYLAVVLANARHFYTDDTESKYAPLWGWNDIWSQPQGFE